MDLWDNSTGWGNSILNELAVMVETIWVNPLFGVVGMADCFFVSNYLEETFETEKAIVEGQAHVRLNRGMSVGILIFMI